MNTEQKNQCIYYGHCGMPMHSVVDIQLIKCFKQLTQCNTNNRTNMYVVYSCVLYVCQLYKLRLTPPMYYICLVSKICFYRRTPS